MSVNANPEAWKRVIEKMLQSGDYEFARDTLTGIWEYIDVSERVTSKQINAIQNIRRSAL